MAAEEDLEEEREGEMPEAYAVPSQPYAFVSVLAELCSEEGPGPHDLDSSMDDRRGRGRSW